MARLITGFELDFLPVGEGEKSGDAILFRYWMQDGSFEVILIDGGYMESEDVRTGETILDHMNQYYFPSASDYSQMKIDHIVCSHPHDDHVGGLPDVMKQCHVETLWINDPRFYESYGIPNHKDDSIGLSEHHIHNVDCLLEVARQESIQLRCPLQGAHIGPLIVASPCQKFFQQMIYGNSFESDTVMTEQESGHDPSGQYILKSLPKTNNCNESSTVLYGDLLDGSCRILLTADAGIRALEETHEYLVNQYDYFSGSLDLVQIPHHGSIDNVNSDVLDRLLGKTLHDLRQREGCWAISSVASQAKGHPNRAVENAFTIRGYGCCDTRGKVVCYFAGCMRDGNRLMPIQEREGWDEVRPRKFHQ